MAACGVVPVAAIVRVVPSIVHMQVLWRDRFSVDLQLQECDDNDVID